MEKASAVLPPGDARRLVDEYCQLVNRLSEMLALGIPDSLLPAPVSEIRTVILALARTQPGPLQECATSEKLRSLYVATASFLPYEEANNAVRLHQAFAHGDRAFISSPQATRAMGRARRIESDATRLAQEFDQAVVAMESGGLLAEIDQFLSDFHHKAAVFSRS